MPSFVTWLDFSEAQQQKVREALKNFEDKGTVDDLGFGSIRDAISGTFFPGTSVLQTRAKYFLFIPWIFQHAHRRNASNSLGKAFDMERKLITALLQSEDHDGVIGRTKEKDLKTLPSTIYWSGLQAFGIFKRRGTSIRQYSRGASQPTKAEEYEGELVGDLDSFWSDLPPAPSEFFNFKYAELALTEAEARWLSERILTTDVNLGQPNLLSYFVSQIQSGEVSFLETSELWGADLPVEVDFQLRELVHHAKFFAILAHGASLLYNVMLVEALQEKGHEVRFNENYVERLRDWSSSSDSAGLQEWCQEIDKFWECLIALGNVVPVLSREFVQELAQIVSTTDLSKFSSNQETRALVRMREKQHKGSQARLFNTDRLVSFKGDAGLRPMTFRWDLVRRLLQDIADAYEVSAV